MHLSHLLPQIVNNLEKVGIEDTRDAQRLVMAALAWTSLLFFEHLQPFAPPLSSQQLHQIEKILQRRLRREPLSRILGVRGFWKEIFFLSPFTLDPRPETEGLVEHALSFFSHKPSPGKILDLGTGTGCLLLSLLAEFPTAWGLGIDIQEGAIATAQKNTTHLNLSERALFLVGNWMDMISEEFFFDLIVSNPPYIPTPDLSCLPDEVKNYDPRLALDGGRHGLACYRHLISQTAHHLSPGGCLMLEIGENQSQQIYGLAQPFFQSIQIHLDLRGQERYIICTSPDVKRRDFR